MAIGNEEAFHSGFYAVLKGNLLRNRGSGELEITYFGD
jgi:hypothetical protein